MKESTKTNKTPSRAGIIGIIIVGALVLLALRIFLLQTFSYDTYQSKVIDQMTTELTVKARRGNIYDRNGNVLATDMTAYNLIISPKAIKTAQDQRADGKNQAELIANGIAEILGEEYK